MHGFVFGTVSDTASDPATTTVALVVAVAGFTVVGLMWTAVAFGRGGVGLDRLRDQNDLRDQNELGELGERVGLGDTDGGAG